jgi:hypothetical protein
MTVRLHLQSVDDDPEEKDFADVDAAAWTRDGQGARPAFSRRSQERSGVLLQPILRARFARDDMRSL